MDDMCLILFKNLVVVQCRCNGSFCHRCFYIITTVVVVVVVNVTVFKKIYNYQYVVVFIVHFVMNRRLHYCRYAVVTIQCSCLITNFII